MAQHQSIGPAEQVLVEFRAVVFLYDSQVSRWSEVGEPNLCSRVFLISTRTYGSMCCYRIFGRLESTGHVTLDWTLTDKDEYVLYNTKWHQMRTATGIFYGFGVVSESEGSRFSVIIQNTLRSLQGTQTQSLQSQAHQSQLAPDAKGSGRVSPNLKLPNPTQRVPDSPGQDGNRTQRKRDFDVQIDSFCAALSEAIMNGKQEQAVEIAKKLTLQKVNLSIKLKNPNLVTMDAGGNTITLRVVVEDKESSGGTFSMKVSPTCTIEKLQQEVFDRFGFPVQVQKWIVGKKVPKPADTLHDLLVRQSGATVFLYLLSGKTVGLRQSDVEQLGRGDTATSSTLRSNASCSSAATTSSTFSSSFSTSSNLRQAVSTPNLAAGNVPPAFGELSREEQVLERDFASLMPQRLPATGPNWQDISGPATFHVDPTMDIRTLQNKLAQQCMAQRSGPASPSNPAVEEVVLNNIDPEEQQAREGGQSSRGWTCEMCTFVNQPTRPGCEVCTAARPEGYVVPVDTMLNEQERNRLAAEQRQEALFQQAEEGRLVDIQRFLRQNAEP